MDCVGNIFLAAIEKWVTSTSEDLYEPSMQLLFITAKNAHGMVVTVEKQYLELRTCSIKQSYRVLCRCCNFHGKK